MQTKYIDVAQHNIVSSPLADLFRNRMDFLDVMYDFVSEIDEAHPISQGVMALGVYYESLFLVVDAVREEDRCLDEVFDQACATFKASSDDIERMKSLLEDIKINKHIVALSSQANARARYDALIEWRGFFTAFNEIQDQYLPKELTNICAEVLDYLRHEIKKIEREYPNITAVELVENDDYLPVMA